MFQYISFLFYFYFPVISWIDKYKHPNKSSNDRTSLVLCIICKQITMPRLQNKNRSTILNPPPSCLHGTFHTHTCKLTYARLLSSRQISVRKILSIKSYFKFYVFLLESLLFAMHCKNSLPHVFHFSKDVINVWNDKQR